MDTTSKELVLALVVGWQFGSLLFILLAVLPRSLWNDGGLLHLGKLCLVTTIFISIPQAYLAARFWGIKPDHFGDVLGAGLTVIGTCVLLPGILVVSQLKASSPDLGPESETQLDPRAN